MSHRKSVEDLLGIGSSWGMHRGILDSVRQPDLGLGLMSQIQKGILDSVRQPDLGLGVMSGMHKGILESMRRADLGLGVMSGMHKGILESMRRADLGLGVMSGMHKGILESMRRADLGLGVMSGMHKGILESMRQPDLGLGALGEVHRTLAESMRKVDMGFGVVSGMHKTIAESMRLAGMGLGVLDDVTRMWSKSFSAMAEIAGDRYSVGALGGAIAAVGLTGRFDLGLMSAAIAAARFWEDEVQGEADHVESAREESVLVDAIAEVGAFAQQAASAASEDIQRQVAIALDAVASKFAERLASAKPAERVSIMNLLGLVVAVISALAAVYYGQIAKDAADSSTQDAVESRAAISRASEQQVEELKKLRASFDMLADTVATANDEDASDLWVIERTADVRVRKATKSAKVAELYPNQVVAAVQLEHKWVRIEYYDYVNDVSRTGWVLKKYMRRLRGETSPGSRAQP
ncbi:SH3 domain-containing protein [Sorangium cellulosum]|nr:SH3 domain-containing protein [Sorangium cellulosum]